MEAVAGPDTLYKKDLSVGVRSDVAYTVAANQDFAALLRYSLVSEARLTPNDSGISLILMGFPSKKKSEISP